MTKRLIFNTAVMIGGLLLSVASAQEEPGQTRNSDQERLSATTKASQASALKQAEEKFFDDDGGQVFIIRRERQAVTDLKHYGGKVITGPQIYSIFLGSGWSRTELLTYRNAFDNLLVEGSDTNERVWLNSRGV